MVSVSLALPACMWRNEIRRRDEGLPGLSGMACLRWCLAAEVVYLDWQAEALGPWAS